MINQNGMDDGSSHFFAGKRRYAKGGTIDSIIASQKGRSTIKENMSPRRKSTTTFERE